MTHRVPDDVWAPGGAFAKDAPYSQPVVSDDPAEEHVAEQQDENGGSVASPSDSRLQRTNMFAIAAIVALALSIVLNAAIPLVWPRGQGALTQTQVETSIRLTTLLTNAGIILAVLGMTLAAVAMRWPGRSRIIGAVCLGVGIALALPTLLDLFGSYSVQIVG